MDKIIPKDANNKFPLRLVFIDFREPLFELVRVMEQGIIKYKERSWKKLNTKKYKKQIIEATFRHIYAHIEGEKNSDDFNCNHLAHAICNLLFLLSFSLEE
jgi:hypothetical protein